MSLMKGVYKALTLLSFCSLFGGVLLVDLGHFEPWLSVSDIPGGMPGAMAIAIAAFAALGLVIQSRITKIERAEWRDLGRQAGLSPVGGDGEESGTELSGTVDGRPVTVHYDKEKVGGGEGSSTTIWHTYADVELRGPAEEGVIVGNAGGDVDGGVGTIDFELMAERVPDAPGLVAAETGDLFLAGTSRAAVEAVASGVSGDALRATRDLEVAAVADAERVVTGWAEAHNEAMEGVGSSLAEVDVDNLRERVPGDASTVTVETRGTERIRDADVFRRFAEGAVVVADAFEEATARTPRSG